MKPNNNQGWNQLKVPALILFVLVLVSGFVLLYNVRLNTTARIHRDAILNRPHPYRFGVRAILRGLSTGCRTAPCAGYLASGLGEAGQDFTQFLSVALIEINFVITAVECK